MKRKILYWVIGVFVVLFIIGVLIPDNPEDKITTQTTSKTGNTQGALGEEEQIPYEDNTEETRQQEQPTTPYLQNNTSKTTQNNTIIKTEKSFYKVIRVIDGDTIEINTSQRVRLICIDTPETNEYYYSEASIYLDNLILNKEVELVKDISEIDRYGRLLRYIYLGDGTFVNEMIVYNGYGRAYPYSPDTSKCPIIQQAEQYAKSNNLGIWGEVIKGQENTSSSSNIICSYNAYNCGDFSTCSEVMEVFNACNSDIHDLDRDNDGIPCESLCG